MERRVFLFLMLIGLGSACSGIFESCPPPTYESVSIRGHNFYLFDQGWTPLENGDMCVFDSLRLEPGWDVKYKYAQVSPTFNFGFSAYALSCADYPVPCENWIESYDVVALTNARGQFAAGDTLNQFLHTSPEEIPLDDVWSGSVNTPDRADPLFYGVRVNGAEYTSMRYFDALKFNSQIVRLDSLQVEVHVRTTDGIYTVATSSMIHFHQ